MIINNSFILIFQIMNVGVKLKTCSGFLRLPSFQVLWLRSFGDNKLFKDNQNFPSIKIKGENKFGEFTNYPNFNIFASVAINGKVHTKGKNSPVDPDELVEGALYAIDAVTNILAVANLNKYNFEDLSELVTKNCFRNIHKLR